MNTGFKEIDSIIGELPLALILFGARHGCGKTSFALDVIINGLKNNKVCLLHTLEMSEEQIVRCIKSKGTDADVDKHLE